jgi:phage protein D/phage baseplate assembly protein gpV
MPEDRALVRQLTVRVDGTALDRQVMANLFEVVVDSQLHLPTMCVLRLHDRNGTLLNQGLFGLGSELRVGIADEQGRGDRVLFVGEITSLEPEFGARLIVILGIRAYDRSHRLHRGVHTVAYQRMADSDIAQQIASEAGLQAEVDVTSPRHEHVYQYGQTHMEFLRERARRIGYDLYVRDRTLYFRRPAQGGGSPITLTWGEELHSFRPVLSLGEQVSAVEVKGWNPENKQEVVGNANQSQAGPQLGSGETGATSSERAFGAALDLAVRSSAASQGEADALAQALLDDRTGAFVQAEGECYGVPELLAGSVVDLRSLGQQFNGQYRITSATHVWDARHDYVTRFVVSGRRTASLRELLSNEPAPTQHWLAMTGIVTNNDDPQDMGRVKVKFPWLEGSIESTWARVMGLGAGNERGLYVLPEVNDEVLVLFEQGDIARPLVVGGLWNGSDAPPAPVGQAVASGSVKRRVWVTRSGHTLAFSDENPATITIKSAAGHALVIDDDAGKIEVSTAGGQTIVVDDNGNSLQVKGGGQISIEAGTNMTIKASGNMNLEASGQMTIKGAVVQLNP